MQLNKQSTRLAILRAELAAKNRPLHNMSADAFEHGVHMPSDPPLPPSYWDDLEHWLKTLAPAKPAAKQPEPAADVWHSEAPSVAGVYIASADRCREVLSYWDGSKWHCGAGNASDARKQAPRTAFAVEWLRLIEADKPARQPAQVASTRHVVCIKAHICDVTGITVAVGQAAPAIGVHEMQQPGRWLPCDASGWVTHVPTADSVCPVPEGIEHQVRWRNGYETLGIDGFNWSEQEPGGHRSDIIAWRPIASKDAS